MFPETFLLVVYTFHVKFYFSGKPQRKSAENLSKTCYWKLIFVIWSYSMWALRYARHVGTWARKHSRHIGTWARKTRWHVSTQDTWSRKHARHISTWAQNFTGSLQVWCYILNYFILHCSCKKVIFKMCILNYFILHYSCKKVIFKMCFSISSLLWLSKFCDFVVISVNMSISLKLYGVRIFGKYFS